MNTYLQAVPAVGWLLSPIGIGVFAGLLVFVMSGLLGRIVLYVETVLASIEYSRRAGRAHGEAGTSAEAR
jgi:hypothetical protein